MDGSEWSERLESRKNGTDGISTRRLEQASFAPSPAVEKSASDQKRRESEQKKQPCTVARITFNFIERDPGR